MLEEHRLDRHLHDVKAFSCGIAALDDYLRRFARQDRKQNLAQIYVLVDGARPDRILGYYTLSAAEVEQADLSDDEKRRLPRYPIPCFRIGRLAIASAAHGQGLGKVLLGCAIERCRRVRHEVGAYALVVDAKSESARDFYRHFGFTPFSSQAMSLYLPLGS